MTSQGVGCRWPRASGRPPRRSYDHAGCARRRRRARAGGPLAELWKHRGRIFALNGVRGSAMKTFTSWSGSGCSRERPSRGTIERRARLAWARTNARRRRNWRRIQRGAPSALEGRPEPVWQTDKDYTLSPTKRRARPIRTKAFVGYGLRRCSKQGTPRIANPPDRTAVGCRTIKEMIKNEGRVPS
jgi:hypothetical protein